MATKTQNTKRPTKPQTTNMAHHWSKQNKITSPDPKWSLTWARCCEYFRLLIWLGAFKPKTHWSTSSQPASEFFQCYKGQVSPADRITMLAFICIFFFLFLTVTGHIETLGHLSNIPILAKLYYDQWTAKIKACNKERVTYQYIMLCGEVYVNWGIFIMWKIKCQ